MCMSNKHVLFFTDNNALVHVINKQSSKDKDLMFFVRKLVLACLRYNVVFKAKHIAGVNNILADALSRLQETGFQANGTSNGQFSHTNPTLSAASELQPLILELLSSSLQKSSLPTYKRSWRLFQQFSHFTVTKFWGSERVVSFIRSAIGNLSFPSSARVFL